MRKPVLTVGLVALIASIVGCQTTGRDIHTVPTTRNYQELDKVQLEDVEMLMAEAERVGAEAYAPYEYASAQQYLGLARAQKKERDSAGMKDYASLAKKNVETAIRKSKMPDKGPMAMPDGEEACAAEFERLKQRYNEIDADRAAKVAPALYARVTAELSLAEHELNQGRVRQAGRALGSVAAGIDTLGVRDSDGDGVPDLKDGAPWAAEDKDGFQDEDGVPDLDNDQDGVPDVVDAAPMKAETKNRWHDGDGAPDEYPELAPICFSGSSAALSAEAQGYLKGIAQLLAEWPELKLHVAGYTDNAHAHKYAMQLSMRRAEKVQEFLVSNGMPKERLIVTFHGDADPVGDNATGAGRAKNRRVSLAFE